MFEWFFQQDFTKTTEWISTKLEWRTRTDPPGKGDGSWIDIFFNSSESNVWILMKIIRYLGCWYFLRGTI